MDTNQLVGIYAEAVSEEQTKMPRYFVEASKARTVAANRIDRSVRMTYDQGKVTDASASVEFVTSAVFTATTVFLILLAI